jgi:predicted ATPase
LQGLDRLGINPQSTLPYLANLVIGDGTAKALAAMPSSELVGIRTRDALRQLILGVCRLGPPVVMVVEDLHWIDTASQGVLDEIVRTATDEPLSFCKLPAAI